MSMSKMGTTTQKAIPPGPSQSNSSALKEDDPKEALNEFRVVVETEAAAGEKGDWYPPLPGLLLHTINSLRCLGASNPSNKWSKSVLLSATLKMP